MAKPIMIQGTMSNAGKSILAAGLCRIFVQDGYKTAPFKSQNMALNSYITPEGLEMGRAQAVQAEAAGIQPDADMNPILLKPTTDVGSQVIVHGVSRGNMKARDYFAYKKELAPDIMSSYRRLDERYDILVIEGAGSPAEINLKSDDIVNMGMARMADAPVLLVGDIDRGGVFAQLYGTVALLTPEERSRVKGLIINKFRGDRTILDPGIAMLEELCHIPVVGVVPYMDVDIEDEDSLSSRLETGPSSAPSAVDLAVIRFPRISNFTDFNVFAGIPGVTLRYVARTADLGTPDMVMLPGTKSTIHDLLWMRQNGLEAAILKLADRQIPIWGICGGYQMMGEVLEDAKGVESDAPSRVRGMGLLPLKTEFEEEKVRTQVAGAFGELDGCLSELSGACIAGYEIHMGRTFIDREEGAVDTARMVPWRIEPEICRPMDYVMEVRNASEPVSASGPRSASGPGHAPEPRPARRDGWNRGNIYGTYVHGVFDGPGIAATVAKALAGKKGVDLEEAAAADYGSYKEQQYDKLARELRQSLDMDAIYKIAGIFRDEKK